LEGIRGSSHEPKVAGPSMLGTGCPDRHAFLFMHSTSPPNAHPGVMPIPSRESGFVPCPIDDLAPAGASDADAAREKTRLSKEDRVAA
jgi:hypothetical protein